jgi:hypothetical protein
MYLARLLPRLAVRRQLANTPTALSMAALIALFAVVLIFSERTQGPVAGAAEVEVPELSAAGPSRPISFRDRLLTGLDARLKSEVAFVDQVVALVNTGQLPQRLVDETFFWARGRSRHPKLAGRTRRAIIYFQPALIARAARINVQF